MISFLRRKMRVFIYFIVGAFVLSLVAGSISLFYFSKKDAAKRHHGQKGGLDPDVSEQPVDPSGLDVNSTAVAARITLNGQVEEITEGELNQQLKESEFFKRSGGKIPPEFARFLFPQELERLIKQRLLTMKADSLPVDVSKEVDRALNDLYQRMGGKEKLLKNPLFKLDEFKKSIESRLKYQKLIQQIIGGRQLGDDILKQAYDLDRETKYKNPDGTYKPFESVKGEIAKELRSVVTENDIKTYYEQHKDRWKLPGKASFRRLMIDICSDKALAAATFTEEQLKQYYSENSSKYRGSKQYRIRHIFIDPLSDEYANAVSVTEDEIKARYEENIDDYKEEEKVKSLSILFKATGDEDGGEWKSAREKAELAFQRILKGEDIKKVAKEVSEDTTVEEEDFWCRGMKDPKTEETVFSLSVGGFSKPVKTERGIEIFKLLEKKEAFAQPLEKVKGEIKAQLRSEKADAAVVKLLNDVSEKIRTKEMTFEDAARKYSQAPSAKFDRAGFVGNVSLGKNEDNKHASELGKGDYIDYAIRNLLKDDAVGLFDPVHSAKGYHLIEVLKVIPAGILPFDKCRDKVEKDYRLYLADREGLNEITRLRNLIDEGKLTFVEAVEKYSAGSDKANGGLWENVSLSAGVKPPVSDKVLEESGSKFGLSERIISVVEETAEGHVSRPVKIAESYQLFFIVKKYPDEFEPLSDSIKDEIRFALNPSVPDSELLAKFNEDKDKYRKKAKLTIQHVMLADKDAAEAVLKEALSGKDFDTLVKEKTIDFASRKRGGTLVQENIPAQIQAAVKGLKDGQVAPQVVDSGVGFHVIRLVKREAGSEPSFEDAKKSVEEELLRPKINALLEDYVTELRNQAIVEKWDGPDNPLLPGDRFAVETNLTLSSPDLKPSGDKTKSSDSGSSK